jgi:hypothetical protein
MGFPPSRACAQPTAADRVVFVLPKPYLFLGAQNAVDAVTVPVRGGFVISGHPMPGVPRIEHPLRGRSALVIGEF